MARSGVTFFGQLFPVKCILQYSEILLTVLYFNICPVGSLSEEGLLVYLRVLQTFLSQLPVSAAGTNCQDANSDSEDEDEEISKMTTTPVSSTEFLRINIGYRQI